MLRVIAIYMTVGCKAQSRRAEVKMKTGETGDCAAHWFSSLTANSRREHNIVNKGAASARRLIVRVLCVASENAFDRICIIEGTRAPLLAACSVVT